MNQTKKKKNSEDELFSLFDKYLKASNNYLPLQAYLQYLETEKLDAFYSICSKPNSNHLSTNEQLSNASNSVKLNNLNNLSSSLSLVKSYNQLDSNLNNSKSKNELTLSQKLYKIIISIDYSPQTSSLDFIKKSLEKTFEKLSIEFNEFFNLCSKNEPQIYITVLLWNVSYFQFKNLNLHQNYTSSGSENLKYDKKLPMPFTILCHSKRLLKSNIPELSSYIFEKLSELKALFFEPVRFNFENNQDYSSSKSDPQNEFFNMKENRMINVNNSKISSDSKISNNLSPFEVLLNNIIRIFKFFGLNEFITPTASAFSHHIHITDGLIYTNDMIGCLEIISKSSITFSFIYSGSRNLVSGSNISSGFGFLADHFFMKFLSKITNGFYAVIDENMEFTFISAKKLLFYFNLSDINIDNTSHLDSDIIFNNNYSDNISENDKSAINILSSDDEREESKDSFCQKSRNLKRGFEYNTKILIKGSSIKSRKHFSKETNNFKYETNISDEFVKNLFKSDINSIDQPFEIKLTHRYELLQKNISLRQIVRLRTFEGFFLIKITKELVKNLSTPKTTPSKKQNTQEKQRQADNYLMITLYFKRYYTQTTIFIYKISYYVICSYENEYMMSELGEIDLDNTNNDSFLLKAEKISENYINEANKSKNNDISIDNKSSQPLKLLKQKETLSNKYFVEIWLFWNFLHLKSNYQNSLIEKVKLALASLVRTDNEKLFNLTPNMLNPPEILKLKEPLFKISNDNNKNNKNSNETRNNHAVITMQNINYELNIRSNKNTEQEFVEFAKSWWHLAFFKHNKNTLDKNYGLQTIKLTLDYDKPLPDANTVLFDIKNTFDFLSNHNLRNNYYEYSHKNNNNNLFTNVRNLNNFNHSNDAYLLNEQINTFRNLGYSNSNIQINSSLTCQNSLNRLFVMLIDWCDIMLVENCVYLKFLIPSPKYISSNQNIKLQEPLAQTSKSHSQPKRQLIGSKNNLNDLDLTEQDISNTNLKNPNSNSNANELNTSSDNLSKKISHVNQDINYLDEDASYYKLSKHSSFAIIRLDSANVPFVSLDFLFHSNISFLDQICLIEKFKEKLNSLNLSSVIGSTSQLITSVPISTSSNTQSNISNPNFNDSVNVSIEEILSQKQSNKFIDCQESLQILYKQNLYHMLKSVFLEDYPENSEKSNEILEHNYNSNIKSTMKESVYFKSFSILNFLIKKNYRWVLNKLFSNETCLSLKETIIDTFIRTRLKEGFKCLFKSKKFIVLNIQIPMFDSGEIYSHQNENLEIHKESKLSQKNTDQNFKNGSSQICSFIYVIRFFNNISQTYLMDINCNNAYVNSSTLAEKQFINQNSGLLITSNNNSNNNNNNYNNNTTTTTTTNNNNNNNGLSDNNDAKHNDYDKEKFQEKLRFKKDIEDEIFFTTELYIEAIDGIYQKRKSNNLSTSNLKKSDYFKNLNNLEIANLIYLIDLKAFHTLQSSYALFLSKTNPYNNLKVLINSKKNESFLNNVDSGSLSNDIILNIANYNLNFLDSVRILPDLNLLPKTSQSYSIKKIESKTLKLSQEPIRFIRPAKNDEKTKQSLRSNQKNHSNEHLNNKVQVAKKKKNEMLQLHEQLKPILNQISSKSPISNIEFQFTLRNILLESSLYVCVFEDIPFNLFSNNQSTKYNNYENESLMKIEELFLKFVDEEFKKNDDIYESSPKTQSSMNKTQFKNSKSEVTELEKSIFDMRNELKSLIIVKLADIKCGDTVTKQIIDDLKNQINNSEQCEAEADSQNNQFTSQNFRSYLKFNVSTTTSRETSNINIKNNPNQYDSKKSSNMSIKNNNNLLDNQTNNFFIHGFFFLKTLSQNQPNLASNTANNNKYSLNASNKLVFFLFNSVPENIKYSLINSQTNTFLIRKFLFSPQKSNQKFNDTVHLNKATSMSDSYRFYCSKKASDLKKSNSDSNKSTNSALNTSINNPTNLIKKCFSISDILKIHLVINSNNSKFLKYIDHVEEICAKSYVKSVIHYMGLHSIRYKLKLNHSLTNNDTFNKINNSHQEDLCLFEAQSISQLLKIGQKTKLIDIDLTDYLKILCSHIKTSKNKPSGEIQKSDEDPDEILFDYKKCEIGDSYKIYQYLEKKFDQIFLKNFNLLPGFNDLFIFMSPECIENENKESILNHRPTSFELSKANISEKKSNDSPSSFENKNLDDNEECFDFKYGNSNKNNKNDINSNEDDSIDDEYSKNFENYYNDYNTFSDSDDEYIDDYSSNDESEFNILNKQSFVIEENLKSDNKDKFDSKTNFNEYSDNKDKNYNYSKKKSIKKKRNKKITVSSPNIGSKLSDLQNTDTDLSSPFISINEQIIGLEFVTVIGSENCYNYSEESSDNKRARTTTLTPDNNNFDHENSNAQDHFKMQDNSKVQSKNEENDPVKNNQSATKDQNIYSNKAQLNAQIQQVSQIKNTVFYSRFSKFNITCLMDLIEDKDKDEFIKLVSESIKSQFKLSSNNLQFLALKNIKIYLRFNWYSFDDINLTNSPAFYPSKNTNLLNSATKLVNTDHNQLKTQIFAKRPNSDINLNNDAIDSQYNNQQINILNTLTSKNSMIANKLSLSQQFMIQNNTHIGLTISNNSSGTFCSSNFQINKGLKSSSKFEYYNLLYPKIKEFRWHLRDEIFQNQDIKLKNIHLLFALMMHIKEGVKRNFTHCHYGTKKIILNKTTITYTTTIIDPKPMTNAARIHSSKTTTTKSIEEDKTILSVDSNKFYSEFLQIIKTLDNSFYNCKLQQINDSFCLNCNYQEFSSDSSKTKSFSFKILLSLLKQTKNFNQDNLNNKINSISPTIQSSNLSQQKVTNEINQANNTRKASLSQISSKNIEQNNSFSSNSQTNIQNSKINQQQSFQRQVSQKQPSNVKQEIIINQIKIKSYFGFNNSNMDNHDKFIQKLVDEFNNKIDELIKLVYLKLSLKEIHDSRKWNSLLYLSDNFYQNDTNSSFIKNDDEFINENTSINDSKLTIKNQQNKLTCNCVWSVVFKLHRLHQIIQKVHGNEQIQSVQQASQNAAQQQYISQGLKKLQETLINFKIDDSNCGDLYVYTKKNEIYLLKLEEIYENQNNCQNQSQTQVNSSLINNQNFNLDCSIGNDSSIDLTDKSISSSLFKNQQQSQHSKFNILSRRPSYASIADSETLQQTKINNYIGKSQNLSGGSVNTLTASMVAGASGIQSSGLSSLTSQRSNPEYVRLNVYGLQPPDKEMKEELCKTLQSELDYSLLIKMCSSIEKNTFKTSSAQHPDRITDEDLTFFKQISDNYFDYELPLPFIFNFNRTMRENFFYFVKQIFNSSFKAIDSPIPHSNLLYNFTRKSEKSLKADSLLGQKSNEQISQKFDLDNEYDELNNLINQNDQRQFLNKNFPSNTTQKVCSTFNQQLSFSYMSTQPSLGPYEKKTLDSNFGSNKTKQDISPYLIQLTRIFFHNSKNRIGKHVHVSLVLVEAYYAIKGLDYLVSSKITRSNSVGSSNDMLNNNNNENLLNTSSKQQLSPNQVLQTSFTPSKQAGPTFLFRFYCKGENDTIGYKESLRNALNNALLYFLSEYLTKIEPEFYLKNVFLKKQPAIFRISNTEKNIFNIPSDDEKIKNRKRHKSMGSERIIDKSYLEKSETSSFLLKMNKSARETKLGKLLVTKNISDENELNLFIINNFSSNLFDHKDYSDTIEYFRESIKPFEYSFIFNNLINQPNNLLNRFSFNKSFDENHYYDEDCRRDHRSLSIDQTSNSESSLEKEGTERLNLSEGIPDTLKKDILNLKNNLYQKSYLRIIYDWLKGLYLVQMKNNTNNKFAKMNVSNQSLSSSLNLSSTKVIINNLPSNTNSSTNVTSSSTTMSPNQILVQSNQSPSNSSVTSNFSAQSATPIYIIRKKISYLTKYNLTSLIREIEHGLRETSKCELSTNYFSFKAESETSNKSFQNKRETNAKTTEFRIDENLSNVNDNVFFDENNSKNTDSEINYDIRYQKCENNELKSCLRNKANKLFRQYSESDTHLNTQANSFYILDECNFGNDFDNLKQTTFLNLHENLSKSENLVITMNVEHSVTNSMVSYNVNNALSFSSSSSSNNQNNSTQINYNRIPSFTGSTNSSIVSKDQQSVIQNSNIKASSSMSLTTSTTSTTSNSSNSTSTIVNLSNEKNIPQQNANTNAMIKSMSSNSSELDSSLSLSNSVALLASQLKRTYLYALVHCKNKTVTFYCFTTESSSYDSIKLMLDQISENIIQRYHLVNNTVLYKFGGLIGENLIYDLKRIKTLTLAACQNLQHKENLLDKNDTQLFFGGSYDQQKLANIKQSIISSTNNINQKMSKSPTINLQNNQKSTIYNQMNSSLVGNLHFSNQTNITTGSSSITGLNSLSNISSINQVSNQSLNSSSTFSIKNLLINQFYNKSYDSIIFIINQQINFISQYINISNVSDIITPHVSFKTQTSNINSLRFNPSNHQLFHSNISSLYGVGLSYQLFEMQQIYRHPRKIYEIAYNLNNNVSTNNVNCVNQLQNKISQSVTHSNKQNYSKLNSSNSINNTVMNINSVTSQQQSKSQLSVNEFYKNYVVPVLIPYHYCCTPLLFYPNWNEMIITENSLKSKLANSISSTNLQTNKIETSKTFSLSNNNSVLSNESWYLKMRQIVLIEYSKYFESRGFICLKDDKNNLDTNQKQNVNQQQQVQHYNQILAAEGQVQHFIKWIQQDGFLYITLNLEECFLKVKFCYSSRYRVSSISFLNEIVKFFNQDFHVHSFIYDFHLSAINRNFTSSIAGSQISLTSQLIAKFLSEFVDFFIRKPHYSNNKIFKLTHEKSDSSLIPHQFRLIFDFIIDSKKHTKEQNQHSVLSFKTLYVFDNNIAIYALNDNKSLDSDYSKYLVVKIENYSVNKNTPITPNNSIIVASNSSRKQSQQPKQNDIVNPIASKSTKTITSNESTINLSKLSDSSSSISIMNTSSIYDNNSNKPIQQAYLQPQNQAEPFIRTICYYLCINKYHTLNAKKNESVLRFNDDLNYINEVIERSIYLYKQEMFWDNLTLSMSSFKNILNENINTSNLNYNTAIFFKVNSQELEQILEISHKIDILEKDSSLQTFLKQCYTVREKIRNYLEFSFGRHFIFTSSETIDYCLLLINDELIKNFRHSESSALSPLNLISGLSNDSFHFQNQDNIPFNDSSNQQLNSFVLLKFDKKNEMAQLLQVNRIKSTNAQSSSNTSNIASLSATIDSSNMISTNKNNEIFISSYKIESNLSSNKYLSFTVNTLMYVLWESLFFSS